MFRVVLKDLQEFEYDLPEEDEDVDDDVYEFEL